MSMCSGKCCENAQHRINPGACRRVQEAAIIQKIIIDTKKRYSPSFKLVKELLDNIACIQ